MSKITYTKDDKVHERKGEFFEVDSCYTIPRSIAHHEGDVDYSNDTIFAALMGDVDELQNKPRRFFDHLLSILEYKRAHDPAVHKGNREEYWHHLIKGAEMWLSAVNNGLYGCVEKLARPVDGDAPAEHELEEHDDEKLTDLLFEFEDALWCAKPDTTDNGADNTQRKAARLRAEKAEQAIIKHFQTMRAELEDAGRYCGICYRPSIDKGGWWCPDHEYQSVYITRIEAEKLREQYGSVQS